MLGVFQQPGKPGEIGALLRREGVYSSALAASDANMPQAIPMGPILKSVAPNLRLPMMNSNSWR